MTDLLDEDVLRRLARPDDAPTAPARPLADVRRRARRLTARRRTTVGVAGAAAGLAAVSAVVSVPDAFRAPGRAVVPAASGSPTPGSFACATGYASVISYDDAEDLLFLPPEAVTGPIHGQVFVRSDRSTCPPERVDAVASRTEAGTSVAAATVYGPGAAPVVADDPAAAQPGPDLVRSTLADGTRTFSILASDGVQGREDVRASWTEPDGSAWRVELSGVPVAQARTLLPGLRVHDGHLDLGSLPADVFPERAALTDAEQAKQVVRSVMVPYGVPRDPSSSDARWSLTISDGTGGSLGVALRHGGMPGASRIPWGDGTDRSLLWTDNGAKGANLLLWSGSGLTFTVSGDITLDDALRVAKSVQGVPPDDPRLLAAKETPVDETSAPPDATPTAG